MMTWLVTGGSGFLGGHVLNALADRGDRVVALGRRRPDGWPSEDFSRVDLDDLPLLTRIVAILSPDRVIHAAGKTPPAPAAALYQGNTRGTANLLAALRTHQASCRVVLVGSAAELGPVPVESLPVAEDFPCRPSDAYGLSKWAATRMGLCEESPLEVVAARVFNPIGPGMSAAQALGRFAHTLASPGPDSLPMSVAHLDACRDFIDARDVAQAVVALADLGRAGTLYHVGTGRSHSLQDGLDRLISLSGRAVRLVEDATPRLRGVADSRADIRRISDQTGWQPTISWERSLADLWAEACRRVAPRRVA